MTAPLPCRYAELVARVALIRTGSTGPVPPLPCQIQATHMVRIQQTDLGIASTTTAQVCVMCAHLTRDLPGFVGRPWPISGVVVASPVPAQSTQEHR